MAVIVGLLLPLSVPPAESWAATWNTTTRVSVTTGGGDGNGRSRAPAISWDGRYVAFESSSSNLIPGDTNGVFDVFVRDITAATTTRVSVRSDGGEGNGNSLAPAISGNGKVVAFTSDASNLVDDDTNMVGDVFVHDLETGLTERVSTSSVGDEANGASGGAALSWDGRYVAFFSLASNLVSGDTNSWWDVFLKDRVTGFVTRVSVPSGGGEGDNMSSEPAVSYDARQIAFLSRSTNMVPGDSNGHEDVFLRDLTAGTTERISEAVGGGDADQTSVMPAISPDGRYVGFASLGSNLVTDDANGDWDVFLRDRETATTERVSVTTDGSEASGDAYRGYVSFDGRRIAFNSNSTLLDPLDPDFFSDVFVRDRLEASTSRVSIAGGFEILADARSGAISGDGRSVVYVSEGSFTGGIPDGNGLEDVYLAVSGEPGIPPPDPGPGPEITPGPPPASPSGLVATAVSGTRIDLVWDDNSTDETLFKIERKTGSDPFVQIAKLPADTTAFSDTGLIPLTEYTYRVRAANPDANSDYSNEATATTLSATPPAAPSGLGATGVSATQIDLTWTDNASDEELFRIERRQPPGDFSEVATVPANSTSASIGGLIPATTYAFRVKASNVAGDSPYSNEATATTLNDTPPSPPSGLEVTATTSTAILLRWKDNSPNETGFAIDQSTDGSNFSQVASVGAGVTTYTQTGLKSSTTYTFRIRATNSGGSSAPSAPATATTKPAPVCRTDQVVFTSTRDGNKDLYVMSPDGSGVRRVTTSITPKSNPAFSHDGLKIFFAESIGGFQQIFSVDLAGAEKKQLTNAPSDNMAPAPSPDGRKLAFVSTRSGNAEIWERDLVTGVETQLTFNPGDDLSPAYSPDSSKILYTRFGATYQVATIPAGGGPHTILRPDGSNQYFPRWSPDGSQIVFVSDADRPNGEIYRMSADGTSRVRLTDDESLKLMPTFGQDRVFFLSNKDQPSFQIYSMSSTDGSGVSRLSNSSGTNSEIAVGPAAPWATPPSSAFLAEGATAGGFQTWVLLSNPSSTRSVRACLTYLTDQGPVAGQMVDVPPLGRRSVNAGNTVNSFDVSTVVEGVNGVVEAERAVYSSHQGAMGAHVGKAAPSPRHIWYSAEGSTAGGFETWILVANPSRNETAFVDIDYFTATGAASRPPGEAIPPGRRKSFRVSDTVPNNFDVATRVRSTGAPVLVERASYVENASMQGATDSPGSPAPSANWFLAEGAARGGFETWILLQNPGSQTSTVRLTYLTDRGPFVLPPVEVEAGRRKSIRVNDTVDTYDVSTKVEVLSGPPIVAERAMYNNDPELGRGAGAGEGVTQAGTDWLAVEGATDGGFTTWILIANPNPEAACVTINYQTAGSPVAYPFNPLCIPANSRRSVKVNDTVTTFDVSTRVTSVASGAIPVRPVVVERAVYSPAHLTGDATAGPAIRLA